MSATYPILPQKSGWSSVTNMSLDTNRATRSATVSGEKSRSSSSPLKGFLPLTYLRRPATTHLTSSRGRWTAHLLTFLIVGLVGCLPPRARAPPTHTPRFPPPPPPPP